jgi:hydroxymethylbilane synthase
LRRRTQLLVCRPDLRVEDIRGNVDTRIRKLRDGQYDALILAAAGLLRLGLGDQITEYFYIDLFTPDAGQGILAVQTRFDEWLDEITVALDDRCSRLAAGAERACVRALGADCRSPVGAYASVDDDEICIVGMAALEDGSQLHRDVVRGPASDSIELGRELGARLLHALALQGSQGAETYTEP